jgi:hypothetical protein
LPVEVIAHKLCLREQLPRERKFRGNRGITVLGIDEHNVGRCAELCDGSKAFQRRHSDRDDLVAIPPAEREERVVQGGKHRAQVVSSLMLGIPLPVVDADDRRVRCVVSDVASRHAEPRA